MKPDSFPGSATKTGRKPLTPGARRVATSISLTPAQHAQLKKLGASKWVRQKLEESMRCKDHES